MNIDATFTGTRTVHAVIGPRGMQPEAVLANSALPAITVGCGKDQMIEMTPGWWNVFLTGQFITYTGRVEKIFGEGRLPVGEGTVEVFEIDPYYWLQTRPDSEICRFRDQLVRMMTTERFSPYTNWNQNGNSNGGFPAGTNPAANYPETTGCPDPTGYAYGNYAGYGTGTYAGYGNGYPNGTGFGGNQFTGSGTFWNHSTYPGASAPVITGGPNTNEFAGKTGSYAPPFDFQVVSTLEGTALRNFFIANKTWLQPYFTLLLPDWWYKVDKIGEATIHADGTFQGFAGWWNQGQNRPDLYFRVRHNVHGDTRYLYKPPISYSTWWNYAGEEVYLPVCDEKAVCFDKPGMAVDDQVIFCGLGFDTTTGEHEGCGLVQEGEHTGFYRRPDCRYAPYGGTLHFAFDIDPEGLKKAGICFYRLSWQKGHCTDSGGHWTPMTTPINRHYRAFRETDGQNEVFYPCYSLVPAPDEIPNALNEQEGIFKFPCPEQDYVVLNPEDRCYGVWNTPAISEEYQNPAEYTGMYTVRMEFFDKSGKEVTGNVPFFRFGEDLPGNCGHTVEMSQPFFYVYLDNRPATARINQGIQAGETSTGKGCGFLEAEGGTTVNAGLQAFQPGGHIDHWRYQISRGSAGTPVVQYNGTGNAGDKTAWFTAPDGNGTGHTVAALMEGIPYGNHAGNGRRCTFNVRIEAYTTIRNGYGPVREYNSWDTATFALIEKGRDTGFFTEPGI